MNSFSVWAPAARLVELEIGGQRISMLPDDNGWWLVNDVAVGPDADYAFAIGGGDIPVAFELATTRCLRGVACYRS
jgi:1,4-alpha-glucan branching enzyme